ncbi:MAG TPA: type II toxin-antitoxin system VapC family toxin [Planctomycetaceae bacterium]|nr:type II toxin-antitoxin system VapC family toxin [Planctomycetaceae bacterium]
MSHLLDTDTCSAYLKSDPRVVARVMQHFGGLHVSVVTVGELLTWALRSGAPQARLQGIQDLLANSTVIEVDLPVAERFGELRAALFDRGRPVHEMDLFVAATALVHNLVLVTHNVQHFAHIPGLTIDDWLVP